MKWYPSLVLTKLIVYLTSSVIRQTRRHTTDLRFRNSQKFFINHSSKQIKIRVKDLNNTITCSSIVSCVKENIFALVLYLALYNLNSFEKVMRQFVKIKDIIFVNTNYCVINSNTYYQSHDKTSFYSAAIKQFT